MTEFLLDTNALLHAIATRNYRKLEAGCHILDLTFYEYGNAMLNILANRKGSNQIVLSNNEAVLLMQSFREVAASMPILSLKSEMMQPILQLAKTERLTFYDASFLYCSLAFKYRLVTGDRKLIKAAANNAIDVIETVKWIEK